ncbi:MAG: hypothetical protein LBS50_02930 [Prevotellaceae bacterium]|jgi:hypothetical protein|nr:hypothetical protein [Prevotellaceae bacterium]
MIFLEKNFCKKKYCQKPPLFVKMSVPIILKAEKMAEKNGKKCFGIKFDKYISNIINLKNYLIKLLTKKNYRRKKL